MRREYEVVEHLGFEGLHVLLVSMDTRLPHLHRELELGWILRRDFWGRGIAKELTAAMLAQTDRDLVLECHPNQTATRRIAELFGFRMLAERGSLLQYRKNAVEHMRIEESDNTTNKLVTK